MSSSAEHNRGDVAVEAGLATPTSATHRTSAVSGTPGTVRHEWSTNDGGVCGYVPCLPTPPYAAPAAGGFTPYEVLDWQQRQQQAMMRMAFMPNGIGASAVAPFADAETFNQLFYQYYQMMLQQQQLQQLQLAGAMYPCVASPEFCMPAPFPYSTAADYAGCRAPRSMEAGDECTVGKAVAPPRQTSRKTATASAVEGSALTEKHKRRVSVSSSSSSSSTTSDHRVLSAADIAGTWMPSPDHSPHAKNPQRSLLAEEAAGVLCEQPSVPLIGCPAAPCFTPPPPPPIDTRSGRQPTRQRTNLDLTPSADSSSNSNPVTEATQLTPFNIAVYAEDHCMICGDEGHNYTKCTAFDSSFLCFFNEHDRHVYVMRHEDWVSGATLDDVVVFVETVMHTPRALCELWVDGRSIAAAGSTGHQQHMALSAKALRLRCCQLRILPGAVVFVSSAGRWQHARPAVCATPFPQPRTMNRGGGSSSGTPHALGSAYAIPVVLPPTARSRKLLLLRDGEEAGGSVLTEGTATATAPTTCGSPLSCVYARRRYPRSSRATTCGTTSSQSSSPAAAASLAPSSALSGATPPVLRLRAVSPQPVPSVPEVDLTAPFAAGSVTDSVGVSRLSSARAELQLPSVPTSSLAVALSPRPPTPLQQQQQPIAPTYAEALMASLTAGRAAANAGPPAVRELTPQQVAPPSAGSRLLALLYIPPHLEAQKRFRQTQCAKLAEQRKLPWYWTDQARRQRTLHIKFLPPTVDQHSLRVLLGQFGELHRVRAVGCSYLHVVQRRYSLCFVEYASTAEAALAYSVLQGACIRDGFRLAVENSKQPIAGGYVTDYDSVTGKPCTFGLQRRDTQDVDRHYRAGTFGPGADGRCRRPLPRSSSSAAHTAPRGRPTDRAARTPTLPSPLALPLPSRRPGAAVAPLSPASLSVSPVLPLLLPPHATPSPSAPSVAPPRSPMAIDGALTSAVAAAPPHGHATDAAAPAPSTGARAVLRFFGPPPYTDERVRRPLRSIAQLRARLADIAAAYARSGVESLFRAAISLAGDVLAADDACADGTTPQQPCAPRADGVEDEGNGEEEEEKEKRFGGNDDDTPHTMLLRIRTLAMMVALYGYHGTALDIRYATDAAQVALATVHDLVRGATRLQLLLLGTVPAAPATVDGDEAEGCWRPRLVPRWRELFCRVNSPAQFSPAAIRAALRSSVLLPLPLAVGAASDTVVRPYLRLDAAVCLVERLLQMAMVLESFLVSAEDSPQRARRAKGPHALLTVSNSSNSSSNGVSTPAPPPASERGSRSPVKLRASATPKERTLSPLQLPTSSSTSASPGTGSVSRSSPSVRTGTRATPTASVEEPMDDCSSADLDDTNAHGDLLYARRVMVELVSVAQQLHRLIDCTSMQAASIEAVCVSAEALYASDVRPLAASRGQTSAGATAAPSGSTARRADDARVFTTSLRQLMRERLPCCSALARRALPTSARGSPTAATACPHRRSDSNGGEPSHAGGPAGLGARGQLTACLMASSTAARGVCAQILTDINNGATLALIEMPAESAGGCMTPP